MSPYRSELVIRDTARGLFIINLIGELVDYGLGFATILHNGSIITSVHSEPYYTFIDFIGPGIGNGRYQTNVTWYDERFPDSDLCGMTLIHVLEGKLPYINPKHDVQFGKVFRGNAKEIVDAVLLKIIELKGDSLSPTITSGIDKYVNSNDLKNEEVRENYRVEHIRKVVGKREEKKFLNSKKIEYWEYNKAK